MPGEAEIPFNADESMTKQAHSSEDFTPSLLGRGGAFLAGLLGAGRLALPPAQNFHFLAN
jgi:hypothetical protein